MKKGLNIYLKRFQYRNAETNDLWKALEDGGAVDVSTTMTTWTRQQGYPVIFVCQTLGTTLNTKILTYYFVSVHVIVDRISRIFKQSIRASGSATEILSRWFQRSKKHFLPHTYFNTNTRKLDPNSIAKERKWCY